MKSFNALSGITQNNITEIILPDLPKVQSVVNQIKREFASIDEAYSTKNFEHMFDIVNEVSGGVERFRKLFNIVSFADSIKDIDALRNKVSDLEERFACATRRIIELKEQLNQAQSASGIEELKNKIWNLTVTMEEEFQAF